MMGFRWRHRRNHTDLTSDNKVHKIRLAVKDGGTDVKLHHLPPRMPSEWIAEFMERYGAVISITEQKCKSSRFPKASSGVRIVRLQLKKAIPSYISIRGYSTYVTHVNQERTCKHCGNIMHRGRTCTENRLMLAEEQRKIVSYADIASGASGASVSNQHSSHVTSAEEIGGNSHPPLPSTSTQQQIKRPASYYADNDSGKKGKSSTENRNVSSDRREKVPTGGSILVESHNKTERITTGQNADIGSNIIDDDQHMYNHQSRKGAKT